MNFSLGDFFWFIFLLLALLPMYRQRSLEMTRVKLIRDFEKKTQNKADHHHSQARGP